jgi:GH43 family beta-xylosidase
MALCASLLTANGVATGASFTNPVLPSGPDPWILRVGKTYYFMVTRGDKLTIRKTNNLGTRVAQNRRQMVYLLYGR